MSFSPCPVGLIRRLATAFYDLFLVVSCHGQAVDGLVQAVQNLERGMTDLIPGDTVLARIGDASLVDSVDPVGKKGNGNLQARRVMTFRPVLVSRLVSSPH